MYNNNMPAASDLPTSRQLLRSTLLALAAAAAILIAVVLPAEYAIDPTGIGRLLGLTEMGEIKAQLAEEASADAEMDAAAAGPAKAVDPVPVADATTATQPAGVDLAQGWRDEMSVVLQPGEGAEIKLVMRANDEAEFSWTVAGGSVNFDTHGDGGGGKAISYEKGRSVPADEGTLRAAFDGNHGWYWRNRGSDPVTVVVRVRGEYSEMKRVI